MGPSWGTPGNGIQELVNFLSFVDSAQLIAHCKLLIFCSPLHRLCVILFGAAPKAVKINGTMSVIKCYSEQVRIVEWP